VIPRTETQAWLKYAIEEMGSLDNFQPQLHEREVGAAKLQAWVWIKISLRIHRRILQ
jgi:hypothetical protein